MALTLGAYRSDVRAAVGHPPQTIVTDDEIDRRINEAMFEVAGLFVHNRLKRDTTITTASGTEEYALPADYWWARVYKDETNTQRLTWKRLEWIEEMEDGSTGEPLYYHIEDEHVRLYPTPNAVMTIRLWYISRPDPLVGVNDRDPLESEFEEVILLGAVQRTFWLLGELDRQVHTLNLQRRRLGTMLEDDAQDGKAGAETVGPMSSETDVTR